MALPESVTDFRNGRVGDCLFFLSLASKEIRGPHVPRNLGVYFTALV